MSDSENQMLKTPLDYFKKEGCNVDSNDFKLLLQGNQSYPTAGALDYSNINSSILFNSQKNYYLW